MLELSAGTFMEIAKDNKSIVRQGTYAQLHVSQQRGHQYSLEKRSHRLFGSRENYSLRVLSYFSPAEIFYV